jgi:hypothetical protein
MPLRVSPEVTILSAKYERLDEDHWIANVLVKHAALPDSERLLFALEPGYSPIEDGGFAAAEQIHEYLKEVA